MAETDIYDSSARSVRLGTWARAVETYQGQQVTVYRAPPPPAKTTKPIDVWASDYHYSLLPEAELAKAYTVFYDPPGDTLTHYMHEWDAVEMYIMGPYGSAKSKMLMAKIVAFICRMPVQKSDQNLRWSRGFFVRNTLGDIERSVLADLDAMFGPIVKVRKTQSRIWATFDFRLPDGTRVYSELDFFGADATTTQERARGFECSYGVSDEVSLAPYEVVETFIGRLGRLPSQSSCMANYQPCFFGAFNPPPEQHPINALMHKASYKTVDESRTRIGHYKFSNGGTLLAYDPTEKAMYDPSTPDKRAKWSPRRLFYSQPPAAILNHNTGGWDVNPKAENWEHTGTAYYGQHIAAKSDAWISVNLGQMPGSSTPGRRVYPSYTPFRHMENMPLLSGAAEGNQLAMGVDFGTTPAMVIAQPNMGGWEIFDEFGLVDSHALEFGEMAVKWLWERYRLRPSNFAKVGCDPSSDNAKENYDKTAFSQFKRAGFLQAQLAITPGFGQNAVGPRQAAMLEGLNEVRVDGRPKVLFHTAAEMTREGLYSAHIYKQVQQNQGGVRILRDSDEVLKTPNSHYVEAAEYLLQVVGYGASLLAKENFKGRRVSHVTRRELSDLYPL